ncbi:MAG: hypothetical protein V1867_07165 [Candidatus Falkowbacteria bacterium]
MRRQSRRLAALDGIVEDYRDKYRSRGAEPKYRSRYNFVLIGHAELFHS